MFTLPQIAKIWNQAGVSTIPILTNGTKRPAIQWGIYQTELPSFGVMDEWWGNGHSYGLALIMGSVSGNLEMLELEGRATDEEVFAKISTELESRGVLGDWYALWEHGYVEESPSGGIHLIYRIEDHPVPGNEKVARRPATADELADNPSDRVKVLAETRGEGGYVIVAPTSGLCHPSGKAWHKLDGEFGQVATISWEVRQAIHSAIRSALDVPLPLPVPAPAIPHTSPGALSAGAGLRPGDDWATRTSWADILEPHGWTQSHSRGQEEFWVRPGKSRRDGHSATTNFGGGDTLKIFSTSVEGFEAEATYSKFGAFAQLNHHGDYKAATQDLVAQGYGEQRPVTAVQANTPTDVEVAEGQAEVRHYRFADKGNAQRVWDRPSVRGKFHFVVEEKKYRRWAGKKWEEDFDGGLAREFQDAAEQLIIQGERDQEPSVIKWGTTSLNQARINSGQASMADLKGVTVKTSAFDAPSQLINTNSCVVNISTGVTTPHDPKYMMTRTTGAAFDPGATCPRFQKFMEEVLPDPEVRAYVQRAVGYSLLGKADQRALFLVHGPSGTGKSTFIDIIGSVFGDYAGVAPAGTFKQTRDKGPSNDIHSLRGKRFVSTSETGEHTQFDEDMLKRISGADTMSTRALYQEHQEWAPECAVWIATNHPPRFTPDDDAIWRRAKLIPFLTQFTQGNDCKEIPGLARQIVATEANGILNWILEGLADFVANGLSEPATVREAAQQHRQQSDPVSNFLDDKLNEGVLELAEDAEIQSSDLYTIYAEWARQTGDRPVGPRKFKLRIESSDRGISHQKRNTYRVWRGVRRVVGASIMGTMAPRGLWQDSS